MTAPVLIGEAFNLEAIVMDLAAETKDQALEALVQCSIASKVLPRTRREQVLDVLIDRERRGSTAFGRGVAMPHARIPGLKRPAGVIARSVRGIDFRAIDGEPVHVFLLLISPENRADDHLATLRWISAVARNPDFLSFIKQAKTREDVLDVLQELAPLSDAPNDVGGVVRATVRIVNKQGLHARPISEFVKLGSRFRASVHVRGPGGEADGASVLQLMGLAAGRDSELEITARGDDAKLALAALCGLVAGGFGED